MVAILAIHPTQRILFVEKSFENEGYIYAAVPDLK